MMPYKYLVLPVVLYAMAGCAAQRIDKFSPPPVLDQSVTDIDIVAAISIDQVGRGAADVKNRPRADFDSVLRGFRGDSEDRNRIQDRVILASNALCEEYKTVLKRKQSHVNFYSGAAAVVFGAAGGVIGGARAAKNLSSLSAISSGVGAEYNEDFYSSLTAHLVANGIDKRRDGILEAIQEARKKGIEEYTLEGAIADAITYHGACSLIGGLGQIDGALNKIKGNIGLDALTANPFYKEAHKKDVTGNPAKSCTE
jgi:hypothetical protein